MNPACRFRSTAAEKLLHINRFTFTTFITAQVQKLRFSAMATSVFSL
jgi:hypothetical protein